MLTMRLKLIFLEVKLRISHKKGVDRMIARQRKKAGDNHRGYVRSISALY